MKKKFEAPELILIQFTVEDIITSSGDEEYDEGTGNGSLD